MCISHTVDFRMFNHRTHLGLWTFHVDSRFGLKRMSDVRRDSGILKACTTRTACLEDIGCCDKSFDILLIRMFDKSSKILLKECLFASQLDRSAPTRSQTTWDTCLLSSLRFARRKIKEAVGNKHYSESSGTGNVIYQIQDRADRNRLSSTTPRA